MWPFHIHQWASWDVVRRTHEQLLQQRICHLCGYIQTNCQQLPCEWDEWIEINKFTNKWGVVVIMQRQCNQCNKVELKEFASYVS